MKYVIFVTISVLISCDNHHSSSEQIIKNFDSVSKSLERTNKRVSKSTITLYAELEKKITSHDSLGKIKNLQYALQGFYEFMLKLKNKFIIVCGDSSGFAIPLKNEDDLSLTNSFFFQSKNETKYLFPQLKSTQFILRANASDSSLYIQINDWNAFKFSEDPRGSEGDIFMKKYFYNTPPFAVITILNKFENDIRKFENQVLANYLKE